MNRSFNVMDTLSAISKKIMKLCILSGLLVLLLGSYFKWLENNYGLPDFMESEHVTIIQALSLMLIGGAIVIGSYGLIRFNSKNQNTSYGIFYHIGPMPSISETKSYYVSLIFNGFSFCLALVIFLLATLTFLITSLAVLFLR